jgi:hypothetical protein
VGAREALADWIATSREGRIAAGLGVHDRARDLLTAVRQKFLGDGNPYETATAALARETATALTRSRMAP